MVAAVNVYVAVPFVFTTGATLLQPRKYVVPFELVMLNRGEPPWHWLVLASVNDAEVNGCPLTPVILPNADTTVAVGQFFSRCSVPFTTVALTQPASAGVCATVPGMSAAAAAP